MITKAERHKFYDELLTKILQLPDAQETLKELKDDADKEYWTEYRMEESALETFFEGNERALQMPEIWALVKKEIKREIDYMLLEFKTDKAAEHFLRNDGMEFKMEDFIIDELNSIDEELTATLKRKHRIGVTVKCLKS